MLFGIPIPSQLPLKGQERNRERRDDQQDQRLDVRQHARQGSGAKQVHGRSEQLRDEADELSGGVLASPRDQISLFGILEKGHVESGRMLEYVAVDPEVQLVVQTTLQESVQLEADGLDDRKTESEEKPEVERTEAYVGILEHPHRSVHEAEHGEGEAGGQQPEDNYQRGEPQ